MSLLYRGVVAFLLVKLTGLAVNIVQFPVLTADADRDADVCAERSSANGSVAPGPEVSLLVPVRDEETRLNATLGGLLEQDVREIVFLDDESTDGSFDLVTRATGDDPRVRVLRGTPRPSGWAGKTWAMHQLAEQSTGDLLVFCDADVHLAPGALGAVMQEMRRQRADAFSVFPRQVTDTLGESLLVPLIDDVLLCFLPFALLSAPAPSAATANGSVFAFDRASLRAVGGFASVRGAVVEDVAMARQVRRSGARLGLALGGDQVSTRMYTSRPDLIAGFARGLRPVVGGSRAALIVGWAWHVVAYTVPLVMTGRRRWWWALPLLLGVLERALVEAKTGRRRWWQVTTSFLSPVAAAPVVLRALRTEQTWKGRTYR